MFSLPFIPVPAIVGSRKRESITHVLCHIKSHHILPPPRDLKDGIICLDQHMQKCFSPEMQQVYTTIVIHARIFIGELCDNQVIKTGM